MTLEGGRRSARTSRAAGRRRPQIEEGARATSTRIIVNWLAQTRCWCLGIAASGELGDIRGQDSASRRAWSGCPTASFWGAGQPMSLVRTPPTSRSRSCRAPRAINAATASKLAGTARAFGIPYYWIVDPRRAPSRSSRVTMPRTRSPFTRRVRPPRRDPRQRRAGPRPRRPLDGGRPAVVTAHYFARRPIKIPRHERPRFPQAFAPEPRPRLHPAAHHHGARGGQNEGRVTRFRQPTAYLHVGHAEVDLPQLRRRRGVRRAGATCASTTPTRQRKTRVTSGRSSATSAGSASTGRTKFLRVGLLQGSRLRRRS